MPLIFRYHETSVTPGFPEVSQGKAATLVDDHSAIWALHVPTVTWSRIYPPPAKIDEDVDDEEDEDELAPEPVYGATMTLVGRRLFIYGCAFVLLLLSILFLFVLRHESLHESIRLLV